MANTNDNNVQHRTSNVFDNNDDCCFEWFDDNNNDCCKSFDDEGDVVFVAVPVWDWSWEGDWEGGCDYDWDGPVTPVDCWD